MPRDQSTETKVQRAARRTAPRSGSTGARGGSVLSLPRVVCRVSIVVCHCALAFQLYEAAGDESRAIRIRCHIYHNASSQPMTRPREVSGGVAAAAVRGAGAGAPWRARTDIRVAVGARARTAASWAASSQTSNPSGRVLAWTSPPKCLRPRRRESFCVSAGGGGGGGGLSSSGSEGGATGGGGSSRW